MHHRAREKDERYVRVCPRCGSPDVYIDTSNPLQPSVGLPPLYICRACNYGGYIFPEVKLSELGNYVREVRCKLGSTLRDDAPPVDVSYGNFEVRVFWKIAAPLTIITGVMVLPRDPVYGVMVMVVGVLMFYITYFRVRKLRD